MVRAAVAGHLGDRPCRTVERSRTNRPTRTVFPQVPLHVEYAMTDRSRSFHPVIDALAVWGEHLAGEQAFGLANGTKQR